MILNNLYLLFLRIIYHVLFQWLLFLSHTFCKCWDLSMTIAPLVSSIFLPLKWRLFPGDKMQESRVRFGNRVDCGQGQGYDLLLYYVICPRIDNTPVLPHTNTSCAGRLLSVLKLQRINITYIPLSCKYSLAVVRLMNAGKYRWPERVAFK
jgi:hypothetical protein